MEATPVRLPRTRPLTNADLELMPEVRSPSTAMIDLTLKNAACERFGVESYWFLDPAARTLVAFELRISRYEQIGRCEQIVSLGPDDSFDFERPFPVRISMAELCRGLDPD